ncbi:MAG: hypothetical protein RMJ37_08120 [Spirochaetia bacterium]|nr:hypothetical protein [Spirochaetota bacterium]MCX8028125.1 hypothetical protein [Thermodesulfovibrionales bacterium]MDW8113280.1 hypothetical protein [Spirochaetia bacterium]
MSFVATDNAKNKKRISYSFYSIVKPFKIRPRKGKTFKPEILYIFIDEILKTLKERDKNVDLAKARKIITEKAEAVYDILTKVKNYSPRMVSGILQLLVAGVDIDDLFVPDDVKELIRSLSNPLEEGFHLRFRD